jgi:heme exporter protein A
MSQSPNPPPAPSLQIDDLGVDRGGRPVLRGVGFRLESGEALLVTGRNGVGKSTLLRALAGLLPLSGGRIAIGGAEGEEAAGSIHYLAHADGLKGPLTARENLEFWARYLGSEAEEGGGLPVGEALALVGLAHAAEAPVAILSAGQKRRIALARLLVAFRPVWLLDEPASALDRASRERLAEAMGAHRARGGIVVAATHDALGLEGARELALGARS